MVLDLLVIWFCKAVYSSLRVIGKHGGALPGMYAEKLRPSLINKLKRLPEGIIIVSGTNGKTTTTHLLSQVLKAQGMKVFTNHSGSNMTRGLLSSIVRFTTIRGKLNYDIAVLEIDEAYAALLGPQLKPRAVILTNVLRDQLDRFGEIDHTANLLFKLAESTKEIVVFNATDSRLSKLARINIKAKKVAYGYSGSLAKHFIDDDLLYGGEVKSPELNYILNDYNNGLIKTNKKNIKVSNLPGWHNALNLLAVYSLCSELFDVSSTEMYQNLTLPYGRGEIVHYKGKELILQLVKNPAGFRTVIDIYDNKPAMIIINDNIADGRDVSWLWDVDFRNFSARPSLYAAGTRAYDMALRLKYDDLETNLITTDIPKAIENFVDQTDGGIIFLTYTSMLQARTYLKNVGAELGARR